jgi:RNA polymerase sigma-70 factor (ECF subfamily)
MTQPSAKARVVEPDFVTRSLGPGELFGADELNAHRPELLRHARRLTGRADDAEDLVQDTLERALRARERFTGGNLRAWLYTIMVHRCHDHFRREKVRAGGHVDPDQVATPEVPEEPPWARVTERQFASAVGRLKPALRLVFELREVHHLPYEDIAARLDLPVNTVGTRLRRARVKLGALLSAELEREERR